MFSQPSRGRPDRADRGKAHLNDVRFNSNWVFFTHDDCLKIDIQYQKSLKIPKFGLTEGVIFNSENGKLSWAQKSQFRQISEMSHIGNNGRKMCMLGVFTDIVVTILVRFVLLKYSQIQEIKAQIILWVQFFPFYVAPFSHILKNSFFLLHRKSNLTVFFVFMWKIVIMCRLRFHHLSEVKNGSYNFQYFLSWISLANKRNYGGEKFFKFRCLFLWLHFNRSIRLQTWHKVKF